MTIHYWISPELKYMLPCKSKQRMIGPNCLSIVNIFGENLDFILFIKVETKMIL